MRSRPVRIRGKVVGSVKGDVYITYRKPEHIYRRVPCNIHGDFCPGFAFSTNLLDRVAEMGAQVVEVRVPEWRRRYLVSLVALREMGAPITDSRTLESQRALPLHAFVELPYEPRGGRG